METMIRKKILVIPQMNLHLVMTKILIMMAKMQVQVKVQHFNITRTIEEGVVIEEPQITISRTAM